MTLRVALAHPSFFPPYLFESATRNGIELVALLPPGTDITCVYEAVIGYEYLPIYDDLEASLSRIVELHEKWKFDGILGVKDSSVVFAAQAAALLGLPGLPLGILENVRNKFLMRQLFRSHGLVTPKFASITAMDQIEVCRQVPFPCVVKPVAGLNSEGVQRPNNWDELVQACHDIQKLNSDVFDRYSNVGGNVFSGILVEEYLEGEEYAVELFAHAGEVVALNCGYKGHPKGPYFEETVYLAPPSLPESRIREIQNAAIAGMKALGIAEGPGHCELRLNGKGEPVILEIGARMGGSGCAQINVEPPTGIDYARLWFASATNTISSEIWPPRSNHSGRAGTSWILPMNGSGTLLAINGLEAVRAHPDCDRVIMCGELGKGYRPLPYFDGFLALIFGNHESAAAGEEFFRFLERTITVHWGDVAKAA